MSLALYYTGWMFIKRGSSCRDTRYYRNGYTRKTNKTPETNPDQTHEEILAQVTSAIETDVKLMLPEDIFVGEVI